jgi:hypothetical protein
VHSDATSHAALRASLAQHRPGETDVDFVARSMTAAIAARDPGRVRRAGTR